MSVLHYPANKGAQAAVAGRDGVISMMKLVSLGKVKRLNGKSRGTCGLCFILQKQSQVQGISIAMRRRFRVAKRSKAQLRHSFGTAQEQIEPLILVLDLCYWWLGYLSG